MVFFDPDILKGNQNEVLTEALGTRAELTDNLYEYLYVLDYIRDLESNMFQYSKKDYEETTGIFMDCRRVYRRIKAEAEQN